MTITQSHHLLAPLLLLLLLLLTTLPLTSPLGLSCQPNTKRYCDSFAPTSNIPYLYQSLAQIPSTNTYANGENIACLPGIGGRLINGAICVWVWNTDNTTTGATVKEIAPLIWQHGCRVCGSAPIVQDGSNDVGKGEVTLGWSWNEGGCDGVCNSYGGSDYEPGAVVPDRAGTPASFEYND
ncbi:hypothetical protein ACLMJK_009322 [Lecanora helva]